MAFTNFKIVTDSSCDLLTLPAAPFAVAPLKIITQEREYRDDAQLDVGQMTAELAAYRGRSSTACPSPGDWLQAFGDARNILCLTITSNLSGSHNAACVARSQYLQEHPDRQIYILDSLSVGPEMQLILDNICSNLQLGLSFPEVCQAAEAYRQHTRLLFMLSSMRNLANNGRVKPLAARAAGLLGIRAIGRASEQGTLEMLDKCRGEQKSLQALADHMTALGYQGGAVRIGHCENPSAAQALQALLTARYPTAAVTVYACRGLCSFYAEPGGLLVGFET